MVHSNYSDWEEVLPEICLLWKDLAPTVYLSNFFAESRLISKRSLLAEGSVIEINVPA